MKKERYITPKTEAIEVKETDIITTSLMQTCSDEIEISKDALTGTGLIDLF